MTRPTIEELARVARKAWDHGCDGWDAQPEATRVAWGNAVLAILDRLDESAPPTQTDVITVSQLAEVLARLEDLERRVGTQASQDTSKPDDARQRPSQPDTAPSLVERLCAAESGSRELDREVALVLGWWDSGSWGYMRRGNDSEVHGGPRLTTSVDALLREVPAGYRPYIVPRARHPKYLALIWDDSAAAIVKDSGRMARTIPLALSAALVKLREGGE